MAVFSVLIRRRRYDSVDVLLTLNVSRATLYTILCWTGSQCNVLSNGLAWDCLLAPRTIEHDPQHFHVIGYWQATPATDLDDTDDVTACS